MWPWRRRTEVAGGPARLPVVPAEWRLLPPIQRAVGDHPLVNPVQRFADSLSSWRDPSYLAPLGHRVGPAEPAGLVADLVRPAAPMSVPDLPVVTRQPAGMRRSVWSRLWGAGVTAVQRSSSPTVDTEPDPRPPNPRPAVADPVPLSVGARPDVPHTSDREHRHTPADGSDGDLVASVPEPLAGGGMAEAVQRTTAEPARPAAAGTQQPLPVAHYPQPPAAPEAPAVLRSDTEPTTPEHTTEVSLAAAEIPAESDGHVVTDYAATDWAAPAPTPGAASAPVADPVVAGDGSPGSGGGPLAQVVQRGTAQPATIDHAVHDAAVHDAAVHHATVQCSIGHPAAGEPGTAQSLTAMTGTVERATVQRSTAEPPAATLRARQTPVAEHGTVQPIGVQAVTMDGNVRRTITRPPAVRPSAAPLVAVHRSVDERSVDERSSVQRAVAEHALGNEPAVAHDQPIQMGDGGPPPVDVTLAPFVQRSVVSGPPADDHPSPADAEEIRTAAQRPFLPAVADSAVAGTPRPGGPAPAPSVVHPPVVQRAGPPAPQPPRRLGLGMPIVPAAGPVEPGPVLAAPDPAGAPAGDPPDAPLSDELLVGPVQRAAEPLATRLPAARLPAAELAASGLPIPAKPSPVVTDQPDRPPAPMATSVTAAERATPAELTVTAARLVGDRPPLATVYGDAHSLPPAPRVQRSGHEPAAPAPYPSAGQPAAGHMVTGLALASPGVSTVDGGRPAPLAVSRTVGGSATAPMSAPVLLPVVNATSTVSVSMLAGRPEAASDPMLQRQETEPEPSPPSIVDTVDTAATAAPAGAPAPAAEPDELLKKLFDPLLRRLKAELRLDRERRGALTDLRH
jgi:hypothetical protein